MFTNKAIVYFSLVPQDLRINIIERTLVQDKLGDEPDTLVQPYWRRFFKARRPLDGTFYFDNLGDHGNIEDKTPTALVDGYDIVGLV